TKKGAARQAAAPGGPPPRGACVPPTGTPHRRRGEDSHPGVGVCSRMRRHQGSYPHDGARYCHTRHFRAWCRHAPASFAPWCSRVLVLAPAHFHALVPSRTAVFRTWYGHAPATFVPAHFRALVLAPAQARGTARG